MPTVTLQQAVSYGLSSARALEGALDILNNRVEITLTDGSTMRAYVQETYDLLMGLEDITITEENVNDAYRQIIDILLTATARNINFMKLTDELLSVF